MYICLCKAVTDKDLESLFNTGKLSSLKEACNRLGVGSDCGTCLLKADEFISEKAGRHSQNPKRLKKA